MSYRYRTDEEHRSSFDDRYSESDWRRWRYPPEPPRRSTRRHARHVPRSWREPDDDYRPDEWFGRDPRDEPVHGRPDVWWDDQRRHRRPLRGPTIRPWSERMDREYRNEPQERRDYGMYDDRDRYDPRGYRDYRDRDDDAWREREYLVDDPERGYFPREHFRDLDPEGSFGRPRVPGYIGGRASRPGFGPVSPVGFSY